MSSDFSKPYDPKKVEEKIYKTWEKSGYFNPDNLPKTHKKPFTIIMPPPNANGSLHIGHAVFVTLEDIMTRYKRMKGFKTLWLPGADHAGFETQVVFDKKLEKEGRSRFSAKGGSASGGKMTRDELYKEIMEFTQKNKEGMKTQLRQLGSSCDWSREKFTLDKDIIKIVYKTFKKLHEDKLLYRGERIVNWCVKHQTALSELETKYIEQNDPLYYMKYGPFTLATVRPETKFGDTAVAVNPKDKRYKEWIGKEIEIQTLLGPAKLKVIADEMVDMNFGTGVVKITPAHDANDFEVAKRHNLEIREVIDQFGKLNEKTGKYAGLKIKEAREIIVKELKKAGLMEKIDENYTHTVATCYKCGNILEPRVMPQWFVKTEPLAEKAAKAVKSGKIKFITKKYEKIFFHWMKNIKDWNISRQIVWGIPIPAKYCECGEAIIDIEDKIKNCPKCKSSNLIKDPDTFDTWFSSGQWPFATLGWPDSKDFKTFYPTNVMETGWDILFFWVARMIMFGIYVTKKVPFKHVYLHGLVRDKDRQKMSKSKGNVIDPLGVAETYGTDALRMALIAGNTPGSDIIISEEKINGYKKFANKLWNVSRFVLTQNPNYLPADATHQALQAGKQILNSNDKKLLKQLDKHVKDVTKDMENFKFYAAAEKIYHYIWHTFADKIIEEAKTKLKSENEKEKLSAQHMLIQVLKTNLKLLHPFMPFITEEIWSNMPDVKNLLIIEKYDSK